MNTEHLHFIAAQWFAAFNDHDLERLLSLYAEDAVHYSPKLKIRKPETNGWVKGKKELKEWWKDAFERLPTLKYEVIHLTAETDRVFMEYIRHVKDEEDLLVGEVLQIEDNLIIASRVYHG